MSGREDALTSPSANHHYSASDANRSTASAGFNDNSLLSGTVPIMASLIYDLQNKDLLSGIYSSYPLWLP